MVYGDHLAQCIQLPWQTVSPFLWFRFMNNAGLLQVLTRFPRPIYVIQRLYHICLSTQAQAACVFWHLGISYQDATKPNPAIIQPLSDHHPASTSQPNLDGGSWNGGTPKSSILTGFSLINQPFQGIPMTMETPDHPTNVNRLRSARVVLGPPSRLRPCQHEVDNSGGFEGTSPAHFSGSISLEIQRLSWEKHTP